MAAVKKMAWPMYSDMKTLKKLSWIQMLPEL